MAAVLLADRFPAAQVIGVDLSTPTIDIARSKVAPELGERVDFQVADAALPFGDARFDSAGAAGLVAPLKKASTG